MPPKTRRGAAAPGFFQRHDNVYLYVPNLIGYARVVLAGVSLAHAFSDVRLSLVAYLLSFVCDELDGRFARKFDQCSEFGKLLDMVRARAPARGSTPPRRTAVARRWMHSTNPRGGTNERLSASAFGAASSPFVPPPRVSPRDPAHPLTSPIPSPSRPAPKVTDRLATTGLLMVLSRLYPERFFLCVALVLLDVGSHWLQMYSQLLASKSSHKDVDRSAFFLLRLYYTNRIFMGVCCVSAEVLYLCALAASDEKGVGAVAGVPALVAILPASVGVPGTTLRATGLRTDAAAVQIAILALPGWALKQIANVAQLKASGDALVRHDARARRKTP